MAQASRKRPAKPIRPLARRRFFRFCLSFLALGLGIFLIFAPAEPGQKGAEPLESPPLSQPHLPTPVLRARNAILWDATNDITIFSKNSGQQVAPASTTKILTSLVVLDYCHPGEIVTVGQEIKKIGPSSSVIYLRVGDRLSVQHLLDGLLLSSGNDAAYALAVYTGRKIAGDPELSPDPALSLFLERMNQKARELGGENSHFLSPDGYNAEGQYSSAADLARFAKPFFQSPILREIVSNQEIRSTWENGRQVRHRSFIDMIYPDSPYYYPNLLGGKTGYTKLAGNCAVTGALEEGRLYICVVLGCETPEERWQDSLTLYKAAAARL